MTRTMFDALYPSGIPKGAQIVAAYVDHPKTESYSLLPQLFPNAMHLSIAAHGGDAIACDVENGAMTPAQVPAWLTRQRSLGRTPWSYATNSSWGQIQSACASARVDLPFWWMADWDGNPSLPSGVVAKQYAGNQGGGAYDLSILADYIPGFDAPVPNPPTPKEDDEMYNLPHLIEKASDQGQSSVAVYPSGQIVVLRASTSWAGYKALGCPAISVDDTEFTNWVNKATE